MSDLRLGWYAVRLFRRPRWTWKPTRTTRTVPLALTWGRWGVQVMRTERHPKERTWFDAPAATEWVVMWEVLATGRRGRGEPVPYDVARQWADDSNRRHPGIRHWPEPVYPLDLANPPT